MEKLSRKEREHKTRRLEILKVAERVFARNGFYNSTVAEIAKESEFAIGTLYQFFNNKEELYYTMMIEKFDLLHTTLEEKIGASKVFLSKLNCLVDVILSFIESNVDFFKIFTWELNVLTVSLEHNLKEQLIAKHFGYIKIISNVVKQGIHEGTLMECDPDDLSAALIGMMNVFSFNWILNKQQGPLKEKSNMIVKLFLSGALKTDR
jgi:AcrR family transcriptional regulator